MAESAGSLLDEEDDEVARLGTAQLQPLQFNVINGTEESELLLGTPQDDQIRGFGGDDDIRGRAGNDELYGNAGDDIIRGQDGDDAIFGGFGNDELYGNAGNDTIVGQAGDDTIFGGPGNDRLNGDAGNDTIFGQGGHDVILGGGDDDELHGGGGNDVIRGQGGDDVIFGNAGDDILYGNAGRDELNGGAGNDLLLGGNGDDTLRGQGGNDDLRGGAGNDLLLGGLGDDVLRGQGGDDVLNGGPGEDRMIGGPGADTFRFTVNDGALNRIMDLDLEELDRLDISAIVNFQPGDDVDDFVQLNQSGQGTLVSIDPNGAANGASFTPLVLLAGQQIESLSLAQLGLTGAFVTERQIASTNASGEVADSTSFLPSLSQTGQFLAFSSLATNLTDTVDTDGFFDIFVKDFATGEVTLLSQPVQGGDGDSFFPAISDGGGRVAFDSSANLPGDLNPAIEDQRDVFLADVASGDISFVSIEHNRFATTPAISGDGELVAFRATATSRAETGEPGGEETIFERIYVRDTTDGSLFEASTSSEGVSADAVSIFPAVSADGRFVAFDSAANNLLPEDLNPDPDLTDDDLRGFDIYVKTVEGGIDGELRVASTDAANDQLPGSESRAPVISADGRYVAFHSTGAFVGADTNGTTDVYRKDLVSDEIVLVSRVGTDGGVGNGPSLSAAISDDGNLVAFRSAANNLVDGDLNGFHDIFVKNITTGEIQRFAVDGDTSGVSPVQGVVTLRPSLSGDGSTVAFNDQVTITDTGGIGASQVVVAPVNFGAGDLGPASLDALLATQDVPVV